MIVACAIDRRFAELAGVVIYSLELNGDVPDAEIYVIGDGLKQSDKDKIQACAKRRLTFFDLDEGTLKHIKGLPTNSNWSRVVYARLFFPNLLPADKGNLLYLDADTMIKGSLRPLQDLEMGSAVIAAAGGPSQLNANIGRPDEAFYFNSGVVLINLREWQSEGLSEKAIALLNSRPFTFPDQDVLNLLSDGRTISLDPKWNAQRRKSSNEDTRIVHFTHAKPNTTYCDHPEQALFLEYRSHTPWTNARLRTKTDRRLNRLMHSIKRKLRGISRVGK
ncbi:LPS:glycosyltransferase [Rhizobium sp. CF122]|uniref:glycosyltransferase family 8 protein n=1 Tax=Rhizobium sp. CF122 TaxID=1144312 RepID=UPI000271D327|nr:glycosyltransferase family 8 protein [Rhizobium sp. CF122]EJL54860.1 LPS:glycosyltransferase [Rhizobium sp. CF122]